MSIFDIIVSTFIGFYRERVLRIPVENTAQKTNKHYIYSLKQKIWHSTKLVLQKESLKS